MDTPWVERVMSGCKDPGAARETMKARQLHGRLVSTEEIAMVGVYLTSEEASSVVGTAMVVDMGMIAA